MNKNKVFIKKTLDLGKLNRLSHKKSKKNLCFLFSMLYAPI